MNRQLEVAQRSISRAGQVASIALGDRCGQRRYEDALARCLRDPAQLDRVTGVGLCHGAAGLYMTAWRAARDSESPGVAACLPDLAARLHRQAILDDRTDQGFLDGCAGTALALHTAASGTSPASGWDACLLIS